MPIPKETLSKLKALYSNQEAVPDPKATGAEERQPPSQEPPWSSVERRLARIEETTVEVLTSVQEQLARIEAKQAVFVEAVIEGGSADRSYYTTAEFAKKVGKKDRTVQKWCREGRIKSKKRASGRGVHGEHMIPASELDRYKNERLLPRKD